MKILLKSHPPYFLKIVLGNLEALFSLNRNMDKIYSVEIRRLMVNNPLFHEVPKIPEYYESKKLIRALFEVMKL